MKENHYRQYREEMKEMILQYNNFKSGKKFSFIEEDSFERIIDYFDEKDELLKAMEAADIGIEQFPFSSVLMIKKADLLLCGSDMGVDHIWLLGRDGQRDAPHIRGRQTVF